MCLQKYLYKGKNRLKIEYFLLKTGFNQVFVKLVVSGVKILSQKNTFLVF